VAELKTFRSPGYSYYAKIYNEKNTMILFGIKKKFLFTSPTSTGWLGVSSTTGEGDMRGYAIVVGDARA
jgi:hypothetical protein